MQSTQCCTSLVQQALSWVRGKDHDVASILRRKAMFEVMHKDLFGTPIVVMVVEDVVVASVTSSRRVVH
jgi:hypothetical protein